MESDQNYGIFQIFEKLQNEVKPFFYKFLQRTCWLQEKKAPDTLKDL